MYLSLTLVLGNIFAQVPPSTPNNQIVIEQGLDPVNIRSNELRIAQQPPVTTTAKESTFQEAIDKKILLASQLHAQKNFKRESTVLTSIGLYYSFFGAPRKGLPYIESSLKISRSINDSVLQCFALNALGGTYKSLGEYQKAQENYLQSIATFPKVTKAKIDISILAQALYGMAAVHDDLGETKEELKYLMEALKVSKKSGEVQLHTTALRSIRTHYFKRGYLETALKYSKEASILAPDPDFEKLDEVLKSFIFPSNNPAAPPKPAQNL